jgi:O-antigen/teichoic acid export membrane protein
VLRLAVTRHESCARTSSSDRRPEALPRLASPMRGAGQIGGLSGELRGVPRNAVAPMTATGSVSATRSRAENTRRRGDVPTYLCKHEPVGLAETQHQCQPTRVDRVMTPPLRGIHVAYLARMHRGIEDAPYPSPEPFSSHGSQLGRLLVRSAQLLAGHGGALMLTLLQGIIVARYLGPADLGLLALVTTFVLTVQQLVDSRAWEATIRWASGFRHSGDLERATATVKAALLLDTSTAVLAWVVTYAGAHLVADALLHHPEAASWIRLYSLTILITIPSGSMTAVLRMDARFSALSVQAVFASGARLAAVLVVVTGAGGVAGFLGAYLIASLLAVAFLVVLGARSWRRLGLLHPRSVSIGLLRGGFGPILRFLAATNAAAIAKVLQRNADVLILGSAFAARDVGQLRVARVLSDQLAFPTNALYQVSYPEYVRLWHEDRREDLRDLAKRITLLSTGIACVGLLLFLVAGDLIVRLAVGSAYLPAVPTMQWLAAGVALAVASNAGHPLLLAMGRAGRSLLAVTLGMAVQLVVLLVLLPSLGVMAAGVAYVAFYVVWIVVVAPSVLRGLR